MFIFFMLLFREIYKFFFFLFNNWSNLSNLAWSLVSKQYSEDEVSEVRVSTSFVICSDENFYGSICCFPFNSINYSSFFPKIWSDGESIAWGLLSKLSSEDGCSEVRVSTSFSICYDENMFNYVCCFSLNFINSSSFFQKLGL